MGNIFWILDILSFSPWQVYWVSTSSSEGQLAWFYRGSRDMRRHGKQNAGSAVQ